MATMNISLPDDLKAFVDAQVAEHGYGSTSEYLRELIRHNRRAQAVDTLRKIIAEGLASGSAGEVTADTFEQMRDELRKRHTPETR